MTRPAHQQVDIVTTHNGESCTIELFWEVDVSVYPIIRETRDSPEEGGPEIEGKPQLVSADIYEGKMCVGTIKKGELLAILLEGLEDDYTPSDEDIMKQADKDDPHQCW